MSFRVRIAFEGTKVDFGKVNTWEEKETCKKELQSLKKSCQSIDEFKERGKAKLDQLEIDFKNLVACSYCDETYSSAKALNGHMRIHSKRPNKLCYGDLDTEADVIEWLFANGFKDFVAKFKEKQVNGSRLRQHVTKRILDIWFDDRFLSEKEDFMKAAGV